MSFGERLKQLIEENNITQRQLSKELNIAPTTLSGYANGYREPDFLTLTLFADYFQVSVDYLIGYSAIPAAHRLPATGLSSGCSTTMRSCLRTAGIFCWMKPVCF